jgi:hypothetical protein
LVCTNDLADLGVPWCHGYFHSSPAGLELKLHLQTSEMCQNLNRLLCSIFLVRCMLLWNANRNLYILLRISSRVAKIYLLMCVFMLLF